MRQISRSGLFMVLIVIIWQNSLTPALGYDKRSGNENRQRRLDKERLALEFQEAASEYGESSNDLKQLDDNLQKLDFYSPPNYDFKYQVHGGGNNLGHSESRLDSQTTGTYFVDLPNGMRQVVTYTADDNGFKPTITYEPVDTNFVVNEAPNSKNNIRQQSREKSQEIIDPVQNYNQQAAPRVRIVRRRRQRKPAEFHDNRYKRFPEFGRRIY